MDDRWVVGLEANGRTKACTVCDKNNAPYYAHYYRSLKENGMKRFCSVKIFTYEEMIEHDRKVEEDILRSRKESPTWDVV